MAELYSNGIGTLTIDMGVLERAIARAKENTPAVKELPPRRARCVDCGREFLDYTKTRESVRCKACVGLARTRPLRERERKA